MQDRVVGKQEQQAIERFGHLVRITLPAGKVSILYGDHARPEPLPLNLLTGINGVCLESGGEIPRQFGEDEVGENQISAGVYAAQKGIPLFITDCGITPRAVVQDRTVEIVEAIGGSMLIVDGVRRSKSLDTDKYSRREVVLGMFAIMGGIAGGTYLMAPLLAEQGRGIASLVEATESPTASLEKMVSRIHPEVMVCMGTIRDLVTAQKIHYLIGHNYNNMLVTRGAAHVNIEDDLLLPEKDRMRILKDTLGRLKQLGFSLKDLLVSDTLDLIEGYSRQDGKWFMTDELVDPQLSMFMHEFQLYK